MTTYFAFCIHNHQPAGNFGHVLEEAYRKSYLPFLKSISKHPKIKITLHTTGFLLDWIIANKPEYIDIAKSMVASGQAEIMGGGFYEPILAVIPERDRIGQILRMSDRIVEIFGAAPRGAWLAERVWEPGLASTLKRAGVEYILVDDFHFIKSGLEHDALGGYYITEDQGEVIKIFPGSERLRYLIPFNSIENLEEHLLGLGGFLKKGNAAIYGDDGEKFGVWPGTDKWVFDDGWLEAFFTLLEKRSAEVKTVTLAEYIDAEAPIGRIYLPTTSYMEMGEWSLPHAASRSYAALQEEMKHRPDGDRIKRFLQGGNWRNFFSKYPESNWMHKRMLEVSAMVRDNPDPEAIEHLYTAQCNDAFWHGVFGGLYLPHLRTNVYEHLIKAERAALKGASSPPIKADIDADGFDEVVVRTPDINLYFQTIGGTLAELDYMPKAVNLLNTLSRWVEGYHHKLDTVQDQGRDHGTKSIHDIVRVKEEGLEKYLKFDTMRRVSFIDRFIGPEVTLKSYFENDYKDQGDFASSVYDCKLSDKGVAGKYSVEFSRTGVVAEAGLRIRKTYSDIDRGGFRCSYAITSDKPIARALNLAIELNVLLPCCDGPACYFEFSPVQAGGAGIGLGGTDELTGVRTVSLVDTLTGVKMTIETGADLLLWRFPVYTVSLSEDGFERIYQGTCLAFIVPITADGGKIDLKLDIAVKVESIK